MKLSLDDNTARFAINAYDYGYITVNNLKYTRSLIVTSEQVEEDWPPQQIEQLNESHMEYLVSLKPEIILLGTGKTLRFPKPSLSALALQQGIGFEVMDTGSACRTYNVLSAEDRLVVAALLVIE